MAVSRLTTDARGSLRKTVSADELPPMASTLTHFDFPGHLGVITGASVCAGIGTISDVHRHGAHSLNGIAVFTAILRQ